MKRSARYLLFLFLVVFGTTLPAVTQQKSPDYGRVPLHFEANRGQSAAPVRFVARGLGYGLFLMESEAVLALDKPDPGDRRNDAVPAAQRGARPGMSSPGRLLRDVIRLQLPGAQRTAAEGEQAMAATANYFVGNKPSQWQRGVPTYARVRYREIYKGVDLVYYGNQRQLEYDFVVAPQADPGRIRLRLAGAHGLRIGAEGDLQVSARYGQVVFHKPVIYQERDGQRLPVAGSFELASRDTISFKLGQYDHNLPLVIDPVLVYASYLGGTNWDGAAAIAVDSSGNAYVAGFSGSTDFPVTSGAYKTTHTTGTAFVSKFNATGTALVYSTYLGGTGWDMATAIAVDSTGNVYVAGLTDSTDFPTTSGVVQTSNKSGAAGTAFVSKLNPAGTALVYSTYLGGTGGDFATAIAINSAGNAYVAGQTSSTGFPTTSGAYKTSNAAGSAGTGFVAELNTTATALTYSSYLGGSASTQVNGLAVDSAGNAYVAGETKASDFPTTSGALQTSRASAAGVSTGFVSKLNPAGAALVYSSYLGGSTSDAAYALAVDASGDAYVAGTTASADFPVTSGGYQSANHAAGSGNAFVAKLSPTGTALVYSTYLGGTGAANVVGGGVDQANAIVVDGAGNATVAGIAYSTDFPVTQNAVQTVNASGSTGFVSQLNAAGSALLYSSYLGGAVWDSVQALALDTSGALYLAGDSYSADFPVTSGALQTINNSGTFDNGFVAKINLSTSASVLTATALNASVNPAVVGAAVTFTAAVSSSSGTPDGQLTFTVDGGTAATVTLNSAGVATYTTSALSAGSHAVVAAYAGNSTYAASSSTTLTESITLGQAEAPIFSPAAGTYTTVQSVTLSDATTGAAIYYTTDGTTPTTASTKYTGAISVSSTTTLQAIAVATGYSNSIVASATYTINLPAAAAPSFSPVSGTYTSAQSVTISSTTAGAKIYYTTDGTTPTSGSTQYSAPITVSSSQTVKAVALASGYTLSPVGSAAYVITTPSFTLSSTAVTLSRGAATGNTATITVNPSNGFTGSVALTAAITTSPSGAVYTPTLSFGLTTPVSITGATSGTATLTITTTAATTTAQNQPLNLWPAGGGGVLACLLLIVIPGRRRFRSLLAMIALGASLAVGATGCGTINSSSTGSSGTTAGSYTITVTGTSGSVSNQTAFTLTVQ